jgi:hypothetical protein
LASTIVDGLGIETEWLDSCSSAFKAGQTAAVVGGLVIGLVATGGAAAALVVAKMVAKQGLKNTLKAAAKTAGKKAADVAARAMKTLRTQADNLGQKAKKFLSREPPRYVYRGGPNNTRTFTPRPGTDHKGLSTFDTAERALGNSNRVQIIDTTELKLTKGRRDWWPRGHVTIKPIGGGRGKVRDWASTRGTDVTDPLTQDIMDAVVGEIPRRQILR